MIVIIDYGMGNTGSVKNMFNRIGIRAEVSSCPQIISKASGLVIPGVGSFDSGMRRLEEKGLVTLLNDLVIKEKVPVLGICLGMQLLGNGSEEGGKEGLGWISGKSVRFSFKNKNKQKLNVPHMGWNYIKPCSEDGLFKNNDCELRFYFVHSYYFVCDRKNDIHATCSYGHDFACAIRRENIYGAQFHPEKSHRNGMRILMAYASECLEESNLADSGIIQGYK